MKFTIKIHGNHSLISFIQSIYVRRTELMRDKFKLND